MVYLLHFDKPYKRVQHYIGYAENVEHRYKEHKLGHGARLTQVLNENGIDYHVVRVWDGDRHFERELKNRKNAWKLCPICVEQAKKTNGHIPLQFKKTEIEKSLSNENNLPVVMELNKLIEQNKYKIILDELIFEQNKMTTRKIKDKIVKEELNNNNSTKQSLRKGDNIKLNWSELEKHCKNLPFDERIKIRVALKKLGQFPIIDFIDYSNNTLTLISQTKHTEHIFGFGKETKKVNSSVIVPIDCIIKIEKNWPVYTNSIKSVPKENIQEQKVRNYFKNKKYLLVCKKLSKEHPDWSVEKCEKEAIMLLNKKENLKEYNFNKGAGDSMFHGDSNDTTSILKTQFGIYEAEDLLDKLYEKFGYDTTKVAANILGFDLLNHGKIGKEIDEQSLEDQNPKELKKIAKYVKYLNKKNNEKKLEYLYQEIDEYFGYGVYQTTPIHKVNDTAIPVHDDEQNWHW